MEHIGNKPYFAPKYQYYAVIHFIGGHTIVANLRDQNPFTIQTMALTKLEARYFIYCIEKMINFAEKAGLSAKGGGGGRVPHEYNDGKHWWWSSNRGDYKVAFDGLYRIPGGQFTPAMLRRIGKMVGEAIRYNPRTDKSLMRKYRTGKWML